MYVRNPNYIRLGQDVKTDDSNCEQEPRTDHQFEKGEK